MWDRTVSVYVLRGYCKQEGHLDHRQPMNADVPSKTNPCPRCGGMDTCDTHWEELRPFDDEDVERIAAEYRGEGGCNVFPGGTPGPFNSRLVIFVDHPGLTKAMVLGKIRSRIQRHMNGQRTVELIFVGRHRSTVQQMFEIREKFRQLVNEWRFIDPTFAPHIEFRDEWNIWYRRY